MSEFDDLKALAEQVASQAAQTAVNAAALKVMVAAIDDEPDPEPAVLKFEVAEVTDNSVTVRWITDSPRFTGWDVGRDGQDTSGGGSWSTTLPAGSRLQKFNLLRSNTQYEFTLTPLSNVDETPLKVSATTKIATVPPVGTGDTAAQKFNWGIPDPISDEFDYEGRPNPAKWLYCGNYGVGWEGHTGNGRRMPENSFVKDGVLTLRGDSNGNTGWLRQNKTVTHGRWEIRVRSRNTGASGGLYHPLALIWPVPEGWPRFGEYDWVEYMNPDAQELSAYLHYPHPNMPVEQAIVRRPGVDMTQWQNIGFEWTGSHLKGFINGELWYTLSGGANSRRSNIQAMPAGRLTFQLDNFTGDGGLRPAVMEVEWCRFYPV